MLVKRQGFQAARSVYSVAKCVLELPPFANRTSQNGKSAL
jgi:hypothetical protein